MSDLRTAAQQALEALEDFGMKYYENTGEVLHRDVYESLKFALAEPVQEPVEPVAGRTFLERILAAMEGVIDVADRKTDEFDALRSCVIDLTLMLHTAPPQRPAEPVQEPVAWFHTDFGSLELSRVQRVGWKPLYAAPPQRKPLSETKIEKLLIESAGMTVQFNDVDLRFARAIERAHGIGGQP